MQGEGQREQPLPALACRAEPQVAQRGAPEATNEQRLGRDDGHGLQGASKSSAKCWLLQRKTPGEARLPFRRPATLQGAHHPGPTSPRDEVPMSATLCPVTGEADVCESVCTHAEVAIGLRSPDLRCVLTLAQTHHTDGCLNSILMPCSSNLLFMSLLSTQVSALATPARCAMPSASLPACRQAVLQGQGSQPCDVPRPCWQRRTPFGC